ncbi:MAG TPA: GTP 3',8-cyclase MoaA [Saprospiraceae bacterium]|nr:GTP 3',8-cyclase MoaA [Saprospiraceae bacterium]HPI08047.1 GTP 3',8-cyclase MoaA [Saprospiraceae bacterium]
MTEQLLTLAVVDSTTNSFQTSSDIVLLDNHGRAINYLRLAVTDRCNLRCHYCMPEHGLNWLSRSDLLSYEEMTRLCTVLVRLGITKVRITGGEPFVRKDLMRFLHMLSELERLQEITLTTNGVTTAPLVPELKKLGIRSVNLSLDTLDRERFFQITRRDDLPRVMQTLDALLNHDIAVKINAVVMEGQNTDDLIPLAQLTRRLPVDVRFIEEMPFNGGDHTTAVRPLWDHRHILDTLRAEWPELEKIPDPPFSTSMNYRLPEHLGKVGIIAAWSRTFCGTCNRIRVTPEGALKTCLYDHGVLQIRDLMRQGLDDEALAAHLLDAFNRRHKTGWEAEEARRGLPVGESMATIGG